MFINLVDNTFLDSQGFSPFGKVTSGMQIVHELYSGCAQSVCLFGAFCKSTGFAQASALSDALAFTVGSCVPTVADNALASHTASA